MNGTRILITSLFLGLLILSQPAFAFFGIHSTEATLKFDAFADIYLPGSVSLGDLNQSCEKPESCPARTKALKSIHNQILHLDGVFHSATFQSKKVWGSPASVGPWYQPETYKLVIKNIEPGDGRDRKKISYSFEGEVVFDRESLVDGRSSQVPLWLPIAWDRIYDESMTPRQKKNHCTDPDDNSRGSFYYYWDPKQKDCPLADDHEHVEWFNGSVTPIPNRRASPEWSLLQKQAQKKGSLDIWVFYGYISHEANFLAPSLNDDGATAMDYLINGNRQHRGLLELGYEKVADSELGELAEAGFRLEKSVGTPRKGANVLHHFRKNVQIDGKSVALNVHVLLSHTDLASSDPTFHHYLLPALRDADILDYDGHSGDGANIQFNELSDGASPSDTPFGGFKPDHYQVFFINGCDSYMNYLMQFMKARGGDANMDLVLSATPTVSDVSGPNDLAFVTPFATLSGVDYGKILGDLEKTNGADGTFLVGVISSFDPEFRRTSR